MSPKHTKKISLRLTPDEREAIERAADAQERKYVEIIRDAAAIYLLACEKIKAKDPAALMNILRCMIDQCAADNPEAIFTDSLELLIDRGIDEETINSIVRGRYAEHAVRTAYEKG